MKHQSWRIIAYALSPRRHWHESLTLAGRLMVCAMLFCGSAWMLETPLLQLLITLGSFLTMSAAAGWYFRPQLAVAIRPPEFAVRGDSVDLIVTLRNPSDRTAWDLSVELTDVPAGWGLVQMHQAIGDLESGQSTTVRMKLVPNCRGLQAWPTLRLVTTFPFNLVRTAKNYRVGVPLLVAPRYRPLVSFSVPELAERFGGQLVQESIAAGKMREYAGSREYQPGIAVRKWDYASWARLGQPIVREFSDQNKPTAAVVVDMCSTFARPTVESREATLSIAAAIGDGLYQQDFPVSLIAVGTTLVDTTHQPPHRQQTALLEALALANPCNEDKLDQLSRDIAGSSFQADVVYFVTTLWDEYREQFRQQLTSKGCQVRAILIVDDLFGSQPLPSVASDVLSVPAHLTESGGIELI